MFVNAPHRSDLSCLTDRLERYDQRLTALQQCGGTVADLQQFKELLSEPFTIPGYYGDQTVSLSHPADLRRAIRDADGWDTHLEVRQIDTRLMAMPVFYLCRSRRDFFNEYCSIVEDLYRSPGFPLVDDRFVHLMDGSHERSFLRLSKFRQAVDEIRPPNSDLDEQLWSIGRFLLQGMFHEDQRTGMLVARHFQLPRFQQAFELVYLVLGSDLCKLRDALDETMFRFVESCYPQPAVLAFLQKLDSFGGQQLFDVTQTSLLGFQKLTQAFGAFLNVKVNGPQQRAMHLHQLIFSNIFRLELVLAECGDQPPVIAAVDALEITAESVVSEILHP